MTFNFSDLKFDALLMVGFFVHLEKNNLPKVICRIGVALKKQGIMYLSLKPGQGESRRKDDRTFVLWSTEELEQIFCASGFCVEAFLIVNQRKPVPTSG